MINKVCLVSREMEGVAGAGGLKDVVRGLADALAEHGADVTVIIPGYGFIDKGKPLYDLEVPLRGEIHRIGVSALKIGSIKVRLLDSPYYSSKHDVYTYSEKDAPSTEDIGKGHHDVHEMNILLQASAVLSILKEDVPPDVIHGHDGHTGLLPLYMKKYSRTSNFFNHTGVLVTIHNAGTAYQQILGNIDHAVELTGFSENELSGGLLEKKVNPLLIAGVYGHVNTVSPGYSRELITGKDSFSGSLGNAYKGLGITLKGVYNGINPEFWSNGIPESPDGTSSFKEMLRSRISESLKENQIDNVSVTGMIPDPCVPWILFHGRLTPQKGLDSILELPADLEGFGGRFKLIVYGRGDNGIERRLNEKISMSPDWSFIKGYNPELTRMLIAASSFVLVPSEWEPCGQIDMIGQLMGALPIVKAVGGLKKIRHRYDGFKYASNNSRGLLENLHLALGWEWKKQRKVSLMRRHAETVIYGRRIWRKVLIRGYFPLYRKARRVIRHRP